MSITKRTILALMFASALVSLISLPAFADYSEDCLYYTVDDGSITITGCFGESEEITVPAVIAGYPVNTVASGAFAHSDTLKIVYLPDTVQTVKEGAIGESVTVVVNSNTESPEVYEPTEVAGNSGSKNAASESGSTSENPSASADGAMAESNESAEKELESAQAEEGSGFEDTNSPDSGKASSNSNAGSVAEAEAQVPVTAVVLCLAILVVGAVVLVIALSRRKRKLQEDGTDES